MKERIKALRAFVGIPLWAAGVLLVVLAVAIFLLDDWHPVLRMSAFTVGMLALLGLAHRYLWLRSARDTRMPKGAARLTALALWLLFLSVPVAFVLSRSQPRASVGVLSVIAFAWLAVAFYLLLVFVTVDMLRLSKRGILGFFGVAANDPGKDAVGTTGTAFAPDRRVFLTRAIGIGAVAGAGVTCIAGSRSANGVIHTPEVPVRLDHLSSALSGFRIAFLSDLHIGPMIGRARVQEMVERTNALKPDLIAIGGDVVDGSVELIGEDVMPLGGLSAKHGVYLVTGNHEYYSGVEEWVHFFRRIGLRVLDNEHVQIGGRSGFDLAGVHDWRAQWMSPVYKPDMQAAVRTRDSARELVVLAHQPAHIEDSAQVGAGLQLSGHTHGGQIWPFGYLAHLQQPYVRGFHRHGDTRTQIYVSCGTGFWGPPVRVDCPPEITQVVLVAG